jgi:hypothetical protein
VGKKKGEEWTLFTPEIEYNEGDDLSENAFRCSKRLKMRFGYSEEIKNLDETHINAIRLAHSNAVDCVKNILCASITYGWSFSNGGSFAEISQ